MSLEVGYTRRQIVSYFWSVTLLPLLEIDCWAFQLSNTTDLQSLCPPMLLEHSHSCTIVDYWVRAAMINHPLRDLVQPEWFKCTNTFLQCWPCLSRGLRGTVGHGCWDVVPECCQSWTSCCSWKSRWWATVCPMHCVSNLPKVSTPPWPTPRSSMTFALDH